MYKADDPFISGIEVGKEDCEDKNKSAFEAGIRAGQVSTQTKTLRGNQRFTRFLKETEKIENDDIAWTGDVGNCHHIFDIQTFNEMLGQLPRGEQKKFEGSLAQLDLLNAPRSEFLKMIKFYMQAMIDADIFDLPCF